MSAWNEILIAFGGNAMLLAVLAYLARSLLQTWLTKDIKRFEADLKATADSELERLKAELKAKGDIAIEELKSHLQQAAFEHQVRFSKLHEKRAEIIAELYSRAIQVRDLGERFVFQTGANEREGQYLEATKTISALYDFYERHRIYMPERVCRAFQVFIVLLRAPMAEVNTYGGRDYSNPQTINERNEAFKKAFAAFGENVPAALKALEDEFRNILAGESPGSAAAQ
jgi:hypothetical protein